MNTEKFRRRGARILVAAMVAAGLLVPTAAQAGPHGSAGSRPAERPVHGSVQAAKPRPADPASAHPLRPTKPVAWPAGTAEVALSAPATADRAAATTAAPVRAGGLPVWVSAAGRAAGHVQVRVLDRPATERAGVRGLLLAVHRTDGGGPLPIRLSVDPSGLRAAYGGDWAARLAFTTLPRCVLSTPDGVGCTRPSGAQTRPESAGRMSTTVTAAVADTVVALSATAAGTTGDYSATTLAESGSWAVSTQSGAFSWSYPMRTPPVPGGLQPSLTASYSSSAVDGHSVSTNNQPSWLGEGWDLSAGFIERQYSSCSDDFPNQATKPYDRCWAGDNASMSLGSLSSELIKDGSGAWHPRDDDGSRVEHLTGAGNGAQGGEYWRITTTDGTQYYFGSQATTGSTWTVPVYGNQAGQPCHAATFDASWCQQAWRWNLDRVVDRFGNTITYYYTPETNSYGRDDGTATVSYTRGGTLTRAEYGTRVDQSGPAPAKVDFAVADRCNPGADCSQHTAGSWPDVPWDQACSTACTSQWAPTFWSTKRLASVTTSVLVGGVYQPVDSWTFDQTFPDPGDTGRGSTAALWLHGITHTGLAGTAVSNPETVFAGVAMANRVNTATDGLPPMDKFRINAVDNESGGVISPHYADPDCSAAAPPTPDSNTQRCFPVYWSPPQSGPINDWFQKYVVAYVTQEDRVGGAPTQVTSYDYEGGAAWAYNDDPLAPAAHRSWTQWRGYEKVLVRHGDPADTGNPQSATEYHYFRGMDGDHLSNGGTRSVSVTDSQGTALPDSTQLAGFLREQITYDGLGGKVLTDTVTDPWQFGPTADNGTHKAYLVKAGKAVTRTALSAGGWRTTELDDSYDNQGNPVSYNDLGDVADPADDRCTRTSYARDEKNWVLTLPSEVSTVAGVCTATPVYPRDAISDIRTYYDGGALGAAPTTNAAVRTEEVGSYQDGTPVPVTTGTKTLDAYGREVSSTDALGHTTTTAYTPATGAPTGTTVTDPLGYASTTTLAPAWGSPTTTVDIAGRQTDQTYDGLGRLTAVWKPGQSKARQDPPNLKYGYGMTGNAPSWVSTQTLAANKNYLTGYQLYDGFLRIRQTQDPGWSGGRVLTDTMYDSRGLAAKSNADYYDTASPGTTLLTVPDAQISAQTVTRYGGDERPVAAILMRLGTEKWRTTTAYGGDHTDVTPPAGGTAITTYVDARGNTTEKREYHGGKPTGDYDDTRYQYTPAGQLARITDPAGDAWSYGYDVRGRQISATDPDKGTTTMTYDDLGEQLTVTDARGKTVATRYDALGRTIEQHLDSATGPLVAAWSYDSLSKGDLDSSTTYSGGNAYTVAVVGYDAGGRPTGTRVTIPAATGPAGDLAGTYTSTDGYRVDGSLSTAGMPALGDLGPETVTYGYDDYGQPATLAGRDDYVTDTAYTRFDEPARIQYGDTGSRLWRSFFYDDATRRPTETLTERETGQGSPACSIGTQVSCTAVDDTTTGYDPAGDVTGISDSFTGAATDNQCFGYDYLRELTEAWTTTATCAAGTGTSVGGPEPYWTSYRYDTRGNRTSQTQHGLSGAADTVDSYTFPAPGQADPHALQSTAVTGPGGSHTDTYGYDADGNTDARPGGQQLNWDQLGRLDSVTAAGTTEGYVYTADGTLLVAATAVGATLYLGSGEVHVDAAHHKSGTRFYTYPGSNGPVAQRTAAGVTYLLADGQGSQTVAVTAGSLKATQRRLDPYGNDRAQPAAAWPNDHGFVGGIQDPAASLTRLGARDYDPTTGRFISVDPKLDSGDPQHLNGYTYAENDPTGASDPTGLFPARLLNDEHNAQDLWQQRASRPAPAPAPKRGMPARLLNDEHNAQDLAAARAHAAAAARSKPGLPARLRNDEDGAQALAAARVRLDHADEAQASSTKSAQSPWDWFKDAVGMGSLSACVSGYAGVLEFQEVEGCVSFDQTGMSFNGDYKLGLMAGAGAGANVSVMASSEAADEVNSDTGAFGRVGIEGGDVEGGDFELGGEYHFHKHTFSDSLSLGVGPNIGVNFGAVGIIAAAGNTGYLWRNPGH